MRTVGEVSTKSPIVPWFVYCYQVVRKVSGVWWTLVRNSGCSRWDFWRDWFQGRVGRKGEKVWCRRLHQLQHRLLIMNTKNFPTNWYSGQPLRSSWRSGTKALVIRPDLCKYTIMNKSQMTQTLQELQDFMFDTMLPANDCVDWYCDRFNVNATDEVIDFVVDAHFAFHGNW